MVARIDDLPVLNANLNRTDFPKYLRDREAVLPSDFGGLGNGVADGRDAIQAAFDRAAAVLLLFGFTAASPVWALVTLAAMGFLSFANVPGLQLYVVQLAQPGLLQPGAERLEQPVEHGVDAGTGDDRLQQFLDDGEIGRQHHRPDGGPPLPGHRVEPAQQLRPEAPGEQGAGLIEQIVHPAQAHPTWRSGGECHPVAICTGLQCTCAEDNDFPRPMHGLHFSIESKNACLRK